jgi:hypothetical protein
MSRTIGFTSRDAARVRLGRSCLWEVLASVRVLREPANHSVHLPWVREVRPRVQAAMAAAESVTAFALLGDLVGSGVHGDYAPDLLTPAPTSLDPSLHDELEALASTPAEVVREQLRHLHRRWTPQLEAMDRDPERSLAELVDVVSLYWDIALAPHWQSITTVAATEVFLRGQQQAAHGTAVMLNDLHDRVSWHGNSLAVSGTACQGGHDLEGGGLCLVPSAFVWPAVLVVADGQTAQLAFPCRGIGTLWHDRSAAPHSLEHVIGRSKANLLAVLQTPLSTGAAAARVGLSVSATSEHLSALRAARLVATQRVGRLRLSVRTSVGDALVSAGELGSDLQGAPPAEPFGWQAGPVVDRAHFTRPISESGHGRSPEA